MFGRKKKPKPHYRIRPSYEYGQTWILEERVPGVGWQYCRSFVGLDAQEQATDAATAAEERYQRGEAYEI